MTSPIWSRLLTALGGATGLILGLQTGQILFYAIPLVLWSLPVLSANPSEGRPWIPLLCLGLCLWLIPDLSDDHHRYLWEGHVQNQGYSPYQNAPDTLFDTLDHPAEAHINHAHLPAIYPPLAQYLFRLSDLITPHIHGFKLIIALCMAGLLAHSEHRRDLSLWAGPLVLFEGAWNAHLDVLGLLPAVWFVHALKHGRGLQAGLMLAIMTTLKIIPAAMAPICLTHLKGRERLNFCAAFALAAGLVYLPFLTQLPDLFTSFLTFSSSWSFNNPVFHGLSALFSSGVARTILTLTLLIGLVRVYTKPGDPIAQCRDLWLLIFLCSPTLYPWYLIWLLPFLPQNRRRYLHLAYAAACLSYLVLIPYRADGLWQERMWWMIPEWAVLLYCFAKSRH